MDLLDKTHIEELTAEMNTFCKENNFAFWYIDIGHVVLTSSRYFTSAKDDVNLGAAFLQLTQRLMSGVGPSIGPGDAPLTVGTDRESTSKCQC